MKEITKRELALCDGKDGRPAWVAVSGKVYDVSQSFLWQNGRHQALHEAGRDLTPDLSSAPHGEELLRDFPIVGKLKRR